MSTNASIIRANTKLDYQNDFEDSAPAFRYIQKTEVKKSS